VVRGKPMGRCRRCDKFAARGFDNCPKHEPFVDTNRDIDYRDRPGLIYLLRSGGSRHYKIGWTSLTIEERVHALQVGNPQRIKIVEVIARTIRQEQSIHAALAGRRHLSEWFVFESRNEAVAALLSASGQGGV
jgi:hypothetical protein